MFHVEPWRANALDDGDLVKKLSTCPANEEERNLLGGWAASLGVRVSEQQARDLALLRSLLVDWNSRMNLTAIRDPHDMLIKHFLDSLTVVPRIPREARVLDVGTGAGFPGLVIRIVRPDVHLSMVEANGRKVGFLEHARRTLTLDGCEILHRHLDQHEKDLANSFGVVVSRSVGAPAELLPLSRPYLRGHGEVICMLGRKVDSPDDLRATGRMHGYELVSLDAHELPERAGVRHIAVYHLRSVARST